MNNEQLTNMGLMGGSTGNPARYVQVEIKGDYNDGDYATTTTKYDMAKPEDVTRLTSLLGILREQERGECLEDYLDETPDECYPTCEECPCFNKEYMSEEELVSEISTLVDLPRGPYGICHTLLWIALSCVDETGRKFKLMDSTNPGSKWGFPIHYTDCY